MPKPIPHHSWRAIHDVAHELYLVCDNCGLGGVIDLPLRKRTPHRADGIPEHRQKEALRRCDPAWLTVLEVLET